VADRRLPRPKVSAAVVDYLLEQIFEGRLRSGDRIDFDAVADELGVSRLPVREAMLILERDGLVSTLPHRGSFVESFDAESIEDDFEIFGLLSGVAVARLARRQDPEVIVMLRAMVDELRATPAQHTDRITQLVQEIVRAEHRAGGSRRLRAELRSYAGFMPWAFRSTAGRSHEDTIRAHADVVQAISDGEPDEAARHRLEDFRAAGKDVVRELERRGVLDAPT
jgi:DNA-binding GntR family transcriptional regulator